MNHLVSRSYQFWSYTPSVATAVIFMLIFIVLTGLHSWKLFTTKTWFCIAFTIRGAFEFIGYIGRCIAHNNNNNTTTTMGPYILANIFILLGPTLFAASIYMTLGRLIRRVKGEHLSPIRVSRLTKTFVWGDVLSFLVQGNSSSLSILGYPQWAKVAVVAGLPIQLVSFSLLSSSRGAFRSLRVLYAVSGLAVVRSVFRIVGYVLGNSGYLLTHEWTMYVFDGVPMAVVMLVFWVWYPDVLGVDVDLEGKIPLTGTYTLV
ncbi:hypothetical protein BO71DRAFT_450502 [Aspergillus ellipticus CBS 707.79]|uniref:RTA1 like protein n=1 Tax=Aspergillus ellipticus CBS 707.79 TaxID=1448320 RepID=A0A319D931_9EURO|nr:hypothetical protein BO71DRAFT_450502 [Aspergillus ellipticus CBS 707.79]